VVIVPELSTLLATVRACRACERHLLLGPRPVLQAGAAARILVVGQAPGLARSAVADERTPVRS
jgi:uracil-DNA glycosylase